MASLVPKSLQTVSFMLFPGTATDLQLQETKRDVRKESNPMHSEDRY